MIKIMFSSVYFRCNTNAQIMQSTDGNVMCICHRSVQRPRFDQCISFLKNTETLACIYVTDIAGRSERRGGGVREREEERRR